MDNLRQLSIELNKKAKELSMKGKLALSIIQGIEKNEKIEPIRAIWEMVQNAHDVSIQGGADIEFQLDENYFYFRHNGHPFTYDSLHALNTQSSSKVQEDIRQIGQYGTGFMTTHKFGLIFDVSGAICVQSNTPDICDGYMNFSLKIDRSATDKVELIKVIDDQAKEIERIIESNPYTNIYNKITEFKYHQQYTTEKEAAISAFDAAPSLVPYVLALIDRVNSIAFKKYNENNIIFKREKENLIEVQNDYILKKIDIRCNEENESVFILSSKENVDGENIPKVSVVLPLKVIDGKLTAFQFEDNIPNHFIYLPLIGTEKWGINYIIHSPLFKCADELRNSIKFVSSGQYGDEDIDRNREIIELAGKIIDSFWQNNLYSIHDGKYIAKVNFNTKNNIEKIADYYKKLQKEWINKYNNYKMVCVQNGTLTTPSSIKVLNREMWAEAKNNSAFLSAIHSFMVEKYDESKVPLKEDLLYWSETLYYWYEQITTASIFVKADDIANYIQNYFKLTNDNISNLLAFDEFLKSKHLNFFNLYRLIPTEKLELKKKADLLKPVGFNETLREVMIVLIPAHVNKFVNAQFIGLLDDQGYFEHKDANTELEKRINNFNDEQCDNNKTFKRKITAEPTSYLGIVDNQLKFKGAQELILNKSIKSEIVEAMLDYCSMVIKQDGDNINVRLLNLVKRNANYEKTINDTLNEEYKYNSALRALVYDCLYKFTIQSHVLKAGQSEFILELVTELFNHSDWKDCIKNYMVYPDQKGVYKYFESLSKEVELPNQLKDWYDEIILNKEGSIKETLVHSNYADVFIGEKECKGKDIANELYTKIEEETKWNIDTYLHKDIILSLVESINNKDLLWQDLFPRLDEAKRAQIMLSTVNDAGKSASIFKFIKFEDKAKMEKLAALGESEDMDAIIALGEQVLKQRREEQEDKEYKTKLGKYVENYIHRHILDSLEQQNVSVVVDNLQGGQDLVITIGDFEYYIEVKSMWRDSSKIEMTMTQLMRSVDYKDRYALCIVNMQGIPHGLVDKNEDLSLECMNERIKFYTNIGTVNKRLADCVKTMYDCPTTIELKDSKATVLIDKLDCGLTLKEFCEYIIKERLNDFRAI